MLKYLPPLKLIIALPDTYPSHSCPDVSFHTPWLRHLQVCICVRSFWISKCWSLRRVSISALYRCSFYSSESLLQEEYK